MLMIARSLDLNWHLIYQQIDQDTRVVMYPLDEYWLDVGRMSEFEKAQEDISTLFPWVIAGIHRVLQEIKECLIF